MRLWTSEIVEDCYELIETQQARVQHSGDVLHAHEAGVLDCREGTAGLQALQDLLFSILFHGKAHPEVGCGLVELRGKLSGGLVVVNPPEVKGPGGGMVRRLWDLLQGNKASLQHIVEYFPSLLNWAHDHFRDLLLFQLVPLEEQPEHSQGGYAEPLPNNGLHLLQLHNIHDSLHVNCVSRPVGSVPAKGHHFQWVLRELLQYGACVNGG
mmetsp:Transcript_22979/g.63815  ORF Transcript_22979/g.63815 Transcript_22979/m.63815 type:complete len:210 (-) Transcript_22979:1311-1940(-)